MNFKLIRSIFGILAAKSAILFSINFVHVFISLHFDAFVGFTINKVIFENKIVDL